MKNSKIEWTDHTFNPWRGCTKVSPACAHCYAESLSLRTGHGAYVHGVPRQRTSPKNWNQPLLWNACAHDFFECFGCGHRGYRSTWVEDIRKDHPTALSCCPEIQLKTARQRIFSISLGDWLDDEVPIEWLADLLKLIHATPNLDWLLLTKRPEKFFPRLNEAYMIDAVKTPDGVSDIKTHVSQLTWLSRWLGLNYEVRKFYIEGEQKFVPPSNVWIGTTLEHPDYLWRIAELKTIPAKVRFLSCEPLLADIPFLGLLAQIDWLICGGESGPKARPMHPDWARSLRDQCHASGIPFFFKQWGDLIHVPTVEDSRGFKPSVVKYFPELGETFARVGKATAGRLLDGKEWSEFPTV